MRIRRLLLAAAVSAAGFAGVALATAPAAIACQPDGPCPGCPKDIYIKEKRIVDFHCPY